MAFARGKFGIEYNPIRRDYDSPGLFPWVFGVLFLVVLVSLTAVFMSRGRAEKRSSVLKAMNDAAEAASAMVAQETRIEVETPSVVSDEGDHQKSADFSAKAEEKTEVASEALSPLPERIEPSGPARRPTKVTNLLMRLEEAEKRRDVVMAIETIEQLRSLPGNPAADIDDSLARRLGALNMRRLFGGDKSPWVAEVVVKRGDTASRIAYEHGSTLASFAKLNGGDIDKVVLGRKLRVMDHPRFNLVVHRLTKTADLSLNGKFFKRYYLDGDVKGAVGAYEVPERIRPMWSERGISLRQQDRAELEMLLPKGAQVLIAEL